MLFVCCFVATLGIWAGLAFAEACSDSNCHDAGNAGKDYIVTDEQPAQGVKKFRSRDLVDDQAEGKAEEQILKDVAAPAERDTKPTGKKPADQQDH
jgi:hypothetical protein